MKIVKTNSLSHQYFLYDEFKPVSTQKMVLSPVCRQQNGISRILRAFNQTCENTYFMALFLFII